jgi:hypothetical protein
MEWDMRKNVLLAVLCAIVFTPNASAQSSNASLSGTVSDPARALMPGVSITATNTATGVVSSVVTNETGTYNVPSLLPGVYSVSAELPGFQTRTFTDVRLGNAAQVRLNFTLEVATLNTTVEVTASAERLLLESSSSVGAVLPEKEVQDLPVIGVMGSDVLSLVRTMAGVNMTNDPIFGGNNTKLAGVSAANVQIQRDGIEAGASARWPAGIQGATVVNPDLVGEIRMILSPVDAELGRGNSQIQIQTKSGSNQFRGVAVWQVQNSALDPNTWANNRVQPEPATRPWSNVHEYTLSLGGPIAKNKTHFFALWNGLLPQSRTNVNATVLTPCAQRGIFRYYDDWNNGNLFQVTTLGTTPTIAVVDAAGNPVAPATNPNGTPHNGTLRYASVFGPLANVPTKPDCSDAIVQSLPWDTYRTGMDPTGYIAKVFAVMPPVNNYEIGDGLNVAGHRWVRTENGATNRFGFGSANERGQLNIKVDHIFNTTHKINFGYTFENNKSDYSPGNWPTTRFPGTAFREPQVLTINFTSSLSPTLLNEARFGMRRTGTNTIHGLANPSTAEEAKKFYPSVPGIPVFVQPGTNPACFCGGQPGGGSQAGNLFNGNVSERSPMYTFANNLSWTHGIHAFKGGFEARYPSTTLAIDVTGNDFSTYARAFGGETNRTPIQGISSTNMPGLAGTATTGNNAAMRGLLSLLSGSVSRVTQLYWLGSAERVDTWDDYRNDIQRSRTLNQREYSAFFKDDWKVHRDWTLNLGVRWDYYGVPWVGDGLTASVRGGGDALFGYSGRGFENWMRPGKRGDPTELIFVGPGSPNPDLRPWKKDLNNFGPAVGFAWQVPWFGAGQTTIRGGYQLSYLLGSLGGLDGSLANPPGSSYESTFNGGPGELEYLDLTDLSRIVPAAVPVKPMQPILDTDRNVSLTAFDSNRATPYVQNLTLAITRNIGRSLTLDTRYVGTLSRKLYGTININSPNFLYNGLKEAFDAARSGGESALLDQMFRGINIAGAGYGAVGTVFNGVVQTGAMHLRAATASQLRNNLANGNYQALANTLNTLNYSKAGGRNANLPDIPAGVNGTVLRFNGFPENFIKTNPQFNNATLDTSIGYTNYHSLQTQATLRPSAGVSFQASYVWSKLLGNTGPYTNPVDRQGDYTLQVGDRRHDFRTSGIFELPFGPQRLLFGNTSGALARIIEGWDASWILNLASGAAATISAQNMLYAAGVPDIVGPFDHSKVKVLWEDGARAGNYFGNAYTKVRDSQCATIASNLRSLCTLNAVADSSGRIILQNPLPGARGTLGQNIIEMPGTWTLDMAVSKGFAISESKRLRLRVDALNIFNHPQPSNPNLNINGDVAFGNIDNKSGNRQFQLHMRLEF